MRGSSCEGGKSYQLSFPSASSCGEGKSPRTRTPSTRVPTARRRPSSVPATTDRTGCNDQIAGPARLHLGEPLAQIVRRILPTLLLGGAAALISLSAPARAQSADAAGDRISRQLERITVPKRQRAAPQIGPDGSVPLSASFEIPRTEDVTFTLSAPVAWTNNAGYAENNGRSSFHVTPAAQVRAWKHLQNSSLVLEGRATVASDIYSRAEENNLSFLQARFEARLEGALGHGWTPYARYQPRVEFSDAQFSKFDSTLHDFTIGATGTLKPESGLPVQVTVFIMRREATKPARERYQPGLTLGIGRHFGESAFSWSLEQSVQGRFFTGGANDGREDFYASTEAALKWTPRDGSPWEISLLDATLELNSSNFAQHDYAVLNVGTKVALTF